MSRSLVADAMEDKVIGTSRITSDVILLVLEKNVRVARFEGCLKN
jgi:hypothetical protein